MVTAKSNVAFGSGVKRFGRVTLHPGLDPSGLYAKRPKGCNPCLYEPQDINVIFRVNRNIPTTKDPWRYKTELEDWSKNLGYRNQAVLASRRWQASLLGPAWHYVSEQRCSEPAIQDLGFGRTSRRVLNKNRNPPPGTYFRKPYKVPYGPHSTRPTFEREEPCRFKDTAPIWSLAPDRYHIVDKDCIEEKSNKIVSLRGPYDLFTGPRDDTTIKNHFNRTRISAKTWPIAFPGCLEQYKKTHLGKMNKTGRDRPYRGRQALVDLAMSVKNVKDPGPTSYSVEAPREFKQNMYGFNSSDEKPVGYRRAVVWPGVGRYSVKTPTCGILGQGHRHVFLSKQKRTMGAYLPQPMNSF